MSIANQFTDEQQKEWKEYDAMECKCDTRDESCADWCDACVGYNGKCGGCKKKFVCVVKLDEHNCLITGRKGDINGKD